MARPNIERIELNNWLIQNIDEARIASKAAKLFGTSRQTVNRIINDLISKGLIEAVGRTQARTYRLKELSRFFKEFSPVGGLKEDVVWRQELAPLLADLSQSVRDICQYGFTEMFNNVVSHSGASNVVVTLTRNAANVTMWVNDDGIGIFKKIQQKLVLDDEHHAILELCKGKLTTDPTRHSGEGVFFTSRMFDRFDMISGRLAFISIPDDKHIHAGDWLLDVDTKEHPETVGTSICLSISPNSPRQMQQVFDRFAAPNNNYGFTKTCIPVHLAKYGSEQLMSRSQARRLLAHFDRFVEVLLDFTDVEMIGQAFADEIFRVFQNERPTVHIKPVRANKQVLAMIEHAKNTEPKDSTLFFKGMEPTKEETTTEVKNDGSDDLAQDGI